MAIPCNETLYRVVLRRGWFDPDDPSRVQPDAFFRRSPDEKEGVRDPKDADGLSLFRAERATVEECMGELKCFGVVSLHVGTLLDLGLNVIEDKADNRKALITNLPFENPGNAEDEKRVGDVARSARIVKRLPKRSDKLHDEASG